MPVVHAFRSLAASMQPPSPARPFASSLRAKLLLFAFVVSIAFSVGTWALQRWIVQPQFEQIELDESLHDVARVREGLARDADALKRVALDYAAWDETLAFVRDRDEHYLRSNLIPEMLSNVGAELAVILDAKGGTLFAERLSASGDGFEPIPELVATLLAEAAPLFQHARPDSQKTGLVRTAEGILLVGASAITDNEKQVAPTGTFLFGKFLGPSEIASLADRTHVAFSLIALDALRDADRPAARAIAAGAPAWHDASDATSLVTYAELRDVAERPIALLRLELPRQTSGQARDAALFTQLASLVGSLALLAAIWVVLAELFVKPLERVTAHAVRVGANADLGARLDLRSQDEIGVLARELDAMVARLEASRVELVDLAHRAGRAQVARMVLHDIGNVLNGMRVGSSVLTETLSRSELENLRRLVELLRENAARLPEFFASDAKGRAVLPFLEELTSALEQERSRALSEVKSLGSAIEHVGALVRSQHGHSEAKPVLELVDPTALVDQAAALTTDSFARHGIDFARRGALSKRCWLDRHRCLQILANLLTNAKQAVLEAGRARGRVAITVAAVDDETGPWLEFAVEDDGVGIAPERLDAIFAFGHTTRPGGQGIGLHSAANLAREMGGSLRVESEGPGRGARFTLRIPRKDESA